MKRSMAAILALLMLISLVGCGGQETATSASNESEAVAPVQNGEEIAVPEKGEIPTDCVWDLEGTIFPLKETVTFKILTQGYRGTEIEDIVNNKDWKSLCEAANVNIEFESIGEYDGEDARDKLQIKLMSEEYGDAIWSFHANTLTPADIAELGSTGILIPLNKFMEDTTIMPNFNKEIRIHENLYNNMKSADGNCYYFCGVSQINAYTANEGLMQVNSEWLKSWEAARGVDHSPETLAEFEDMLDYFCNSDLNGNGSKDEIPYFIAQDMYAGCATLEHAMGMFGIATKDSTADMDIQIDDDGNCYYVYTTDTYKNALKKFAEWYSKGYVWEDAFTANQETITGVVGNASERFGVINICENLAGFETLLPPAIDGYQARYHMHPSVRLGTRQPNIVITESCENPEILAAFIDLLFNFDNNIRYYYGSYLLDNYVQIVDGKYDFTNLSQRDGSPLDTPDIAVTNYLGGFEDHTLDNFSKKVNIDSYYGEQTRVKGYTIYEEKGYWNPTENLWPRCGVLPEDSEDYSFMYTDVATTVKEYRAKFVTGILDVDAEWDNFQAKLEQLGIKDMQDMIQRSYDAFINK